MDKLKTPLGHDVHRACEIPRSFVDSVRTPLASECYDLLGRAVRPDDARLVAAPPDAGIFEGSAAPCFGRQRVSGKDDDQYADGVEIPNGSSRIPRPLGLLLGEDFFHSVTSVRIIKPRPTDQDPFGPLSNLAVLDGSPTMASRFSTA